MQILVEATHKVEFEIGSQKYLVYCYDSNKSKDHIETATLLVNLLIITEKVTNIKVYKYGKCCQCGTQTWVEVG